MTVPIVDFGLVAKLCGEKITNDRGEQIVTIAHSFPDAVNFMQELCHKFVVYVVVHDNARA